MGTAFQCDLCGGAFTGFPSSPLTVKLDTEGRRFRFPAPTLKARTGVLSDSQADLCTPCLIRVLLESVEKLGGRDGTT